jgi:hypothetical protein
MNAAAIILKQNRLMRQFRVAGATSPATARTPEDIGCRLGWIFRRMVARSVFIPIGDGKFYMDEDATSSFVQRRRIKAIVLLGVILLVFIFVWIAVQH